MLRCIDIVKDYHVDNGHRRILDGINLQVEKGEKLGILGRNGAGKSTLIKIIGGVELPTSGRIEHTMSISWPLAFGGAFQGSLSGLDNLRFICRIYNLDYTKTRKYVDDFAELGKQLMDPVKTYSSGMRARLAFALSVVIEFDCYLIDEVIMVGDARFYERCREELFVKRADRALIIVSHDMHFVKEICDRSVVIHDRKMVECSSVQEGIDLYHSL
ncbi:ABC transporter ATP-binding protein [Komagataeibacter oboediens]|uniref:ABC transporter ATP-binding protein n=1 Tax=Komagataeibacter oboediens TaxID=65958 RepID=A0ABS5SLH7_9PROT|nr:ABC transporter ATP-binding protein [Komagataeibacter oboediens]MBL7232368.1 ABC transporter ATP-binding protein [Komagataeibacter oboediens]MBT0674647.1 ABC transporter ATP-binding protein [Komagataeibacter oboediens]MBT0677577.1 ABC transporter ATP-binding protein [Komagataeibacter oboediens]WEQ52814.1 ABC transporter ATP-binding protein [Komagataeibacter oboediens]GCE80532.1 O-antigen ABC transporter ATP-binding protein [Komagataeibacter oboediens]